MKPQTNLFKKSWAGIVASSFVVIGLGLMAIHARADEWNKRTVLTINAPMQVTDTYLEPGSYVFKLLGSQSNRHIVQIYNADQTHLIATILAIPDYRVQVTGKSQFRMWETPAGYVAALRDWYWPGDSFGQQFPYPKNLRQIETAQVTPPPPPPAPQAEPAPQPQPEAQAEVPPPAVEAQNNPPAPPPAAEQPAPAPAPQPAPATLPQTASPYPLIGFIGTLLLGIGGLLRQTRSA